MNPINTGDRLAELESITREYSRYSHSAGGASSMAGGLFALVSFTLGAFAPATTAVAATLVAMPLVWVAGKQILASRYYQWAGRVDEALKVEHKRTQWWLSMGVTGLVAAVVLGVLAGAEGADRTLSRPVLGAFIALVVLMPVVAWRWLRTPIDLAIGTFLLCQAALAVTGRSNGLSSPAIIFVPLALLMIAQGWRDHRRFRLLEVRMSRFLGAPGIGS